MALLVNENLPEADRPRVQKAIERYKAWVQAMDAIDLEGDALLTELVRLLNAYKRTIEVDLIFDSPGRRMQDQLR